MEEYHRMVRLGRHRRGAPPSLDDGGAIDAVTRADVHGVAEEVFSSPQVLGAVGPFSGADLEQFVQ
jgi:hypothetical protein